MTEVVLPVAAVRCPEGPAADQALATAATTLRAEGWRVAGHVQRSAPGSSRRKVEVEEVATGLRKAITQDLGAGAESCALDPEALARVAADLLAELDRPVDLLIVNRFGRGEAEGGGLRAAIEKACFAGVPVVAVVRSTYAEAWEEFTGSAVILDPDPALILGWVRSVRTPV